MINLKEMIDKELKFEPYQFDTTEISGVPVYYRHFDFAPCIHIRIVFKYGAMHDDVGKEGTAHFLEHMLFKGTDIFADEKAIEDFRKTIMLNTLNAHTGYFELVIKGKFLPHNMKKAIEGLFSMAITPKLTIEAFEQEKKVITQEAWNRFLNEKYLAYIKQIRENRYQQFPYLLRMGSPLGYPETILNITHEDITKAHKSFLTNANMEIYIAGNIKDSQEIDKLKKLISIEISKMNLGEKASLPNIPTNLSNPKVLVFDNTYEAIGLTPKKEASVSLSKTWSRVDKVAGQKNTPLENFHLATASLASKLISDIVYEKLRIDNSWCYSAGAGFSLNTDHVSLSIGSDVNSDHIDETVDICRNIIEDIKKGFYKDKFEMRKILAIEASLASEILTTEIINDVVHDMIIVNEITTLRQLLEDWEKVQFTDVQKFVTEYLTEDSIFLEIIRPNKDK